MGICVVSYTLKDIRDEEVIIASFFKMFFLKFNTKRSVDIVFNLICACVIDIP